MTLYLKQSKKYVMPQVVIKHFPQQLLHIVKSIQIGLVVNVIVCFTKKSIRPSEILNRLNQREPHVLRTSHHVIQHILQNRE